MSENVWTYLDMSEHVRTCLNISDHVWTYYSDSDSESESEPESLESEDELDDNLPSCPLFLLPSAPPSPPPAGSDPPLDPPGPEVPSEPPWAPRFCPASERFLRGFFFRDEATKCSNARKVEVFKVSKSISISSGLESRRAGSLCWMIWTTCNNNITDYFKWKSFIFHQVKPNIDDIDSCFLQIMFSVWDSNWTYQHYFFYLFLKSFFFKYAFVFKLGCLVISN